MSKIDERAATEQARNPADSSLSLPHKEIVRAVDQLDLRKVKAFARIISEAARSGKSIYTFGNGGSGGLACHLATELMHISWSSFPNPLRAISLSSNEVLLTALANDYGFERLFEVQLRSLLRPGDIVLAISASGASRNVLRALRFAQHTGAIVLGLTGSNKAPLVSLCNQSFGVRSRKVYAIETAHLCFIHLLAIRIRKLLRVI